MKNIIIAISFALNVIFGMWLAWNWSEYTETRREAQVVVDENNKLKSVFLNSTKLAMYEQCADREYDIRAGAGLWDTSKCLEIMYKFAQDLERQLKEKHNNSWNDQLLITCQNNLKVANNRAQSLENDLKVERQNVTAKEEEIKASKEESSTTVAKKDSNNGKKKVKKGSSKSGKDGVASSDCLQTCNEMVAAAVDPLEKTIAGLKTELTTAQELNKNYKQVIQTLEDDVQNKAQKIQELEEKNDRLIREIGDDGFSEGDASIRGVPSHTNNVGCALSWSTAQPNAPPGV